MSDQSGGQLTRAELDTIINDTRKKVREEMIGQFAKWIIGGAIVLLGFAALGAWAVLLPWLQKQIGAVPDTAIIAFDNPPSTGCPEGWSPFKEATSRVIIGAGNADDFYEARFATDANGSPLSPRAYRQHGGVEQTRLEPSNLPEHSHQVFVGGDRDNSFVDFTGFEERTDRNSPRVANHDKRHPYGSGKTFTTLDQGREAASFTNMPPFVALYYCKKS